MKITILTLAVFCWAGAAFAQTVPAARSVSRPLKAEETAYDDLLKGVKHKSDSLNAEFKKLSLEERKSSPSRDQIVAQTKKVSEQRKALQAQFVETHPESLLSLAIIKDIGGFLVKPEIEEPLFMKLSKNVRESEPGKELAKRIERGKKLAIGQPAPMFSQTDTVGKMISLSDYSGKYVLVDFWASWCGPCRAENPNVLKAYNQYKRRNFTVLGVSIDTEKAKDAWLKAIKDDGMPWTQVSDLKGWENVAAVLYDVHGIPQNYLVDPSGKIIAKNIRGEELHETLGKLLPAL